MRYTWKTALLLLAIALSNRPALAVTRIQTLCTIEGQTELTLRGLGLVVGLPGTGDPRDSTATIRAYAAYLRQSSNPILKLDEIRNVSQIALVEVSARIPKSGINRGERIDLRVSAIGGAKSLKGGMLIQTALQLSGIADETAICLASGPVQLDDPSVLTQGLVPTGGIMMQAVDVNIVRADRSVRLQIDRSHAGYTMAREIERAVNQRFYVETRNQSIARAVSPVAVDVEIPEQYENPVEFVALLMEISVKDAGNPARVVVNARQGTVIVTGSVEISPVVVAHKNLSVDIAEPFVEVRDSSASRQSPQQLTDLITALNQLKVPTDDIISILRELHASGHLHAEFIEQ